MITNVLPPFLWFTVYISNAQCTIDFLSTCFSNILYVVVLFYFIPFPSFYRVVVRALWPYLYSARTVCIEHCLDVNHVCITVCEEY